MLTSSCPNAGICCDDQNHQASAASNFWSQLLPVAALACILWSSGANARAAGFGPHESKTIQIDVSVAPRLRLQPVVAAMSTRSDAGAPTYLCYAHPLKPLETTGSRRNPRSATSGSIAKVRDDPTDASASWLSYSAVPSGEWKAAVNAGCQHAGSGEVLEQAPQSQRLSGAQTTAASAPLVLIVPD